VVRRKYEDLWNRVWYYDATYVHFSASVLKSMETDVPGGIGFERKVK
jgi:hypothetical protein